MAVDVCVPDRVVATLLSRSRRNQPRPMPGSSSQNRFQRTPKRAHFGGFRERRIRDTAERLVVAGSSGLTEQEYEERLDHVVMAGPEGNEFCVV